MQNLTPAREAIAKTFSTGSQKVSHAFGNFWAEIESMREKEKAKREGDQHSTLTDAITLERERRSPKTDLKADRESIKLPQPSQKSRKFLRLQSHVNGCLLES